jgi:hypothetical protein
MPICNLREISTMYGVLGFSELLTIVIHFVETLYLLFPVYSLKRLVIRASQHDQNTQGIATLIIR